MKKDDRSGLNPFTGKSHLDVINDDKFLQQCKNEYNKIIRSKKLLDNTKKGILVNHVASNLINAVEDYLAAIGRSDYTRNYYDWEFHVVGENVLNAFCMPGGKIVFFAGMFNVIKSEDEIAFILAHEMAHALLDHSRTQQSAQTVKNGITTLARLGSIGLSIAGFGEAAALGRAVTNVADVGSEFFVMKPFGRGHEIEADKLGMFITHLAGYDISKMPEFWARFSKHSSNNHDFFSTHPADNKRIDAMKEVITSINNGVDFYSTPILSNKKSSSRSNNLTCKNCGHPIESTDSFCINCGTKINNEPVLNQNKISSSNPYFDKNSDVAAVSDVIDNKETCPNCGEEIKADNNFCINCGTKIEPNHPLKENHISKIKNTCPNCGEVLKENYKFCTHCGEELEKEFKEMVCPNCGSSISENDNFCIECGTKLTEESTNNNLVCSECGEKVLPEDKFCINCGKKLNN